MNSTCGGCGSSVNKFVEKTSNCEMCNHSVCCSTCTQANGNICKTCAKLTKLEKEVLSLGAAVDEIKAQLELLVVTVAALTNGKAQ